MASFKVIDKKLYVKGLNAGVLLFYNFVFLILLLLLFGLMTLVEIKQGLDAGSGIALGSVLILLFLSQILLIITYRKRLRTVIVFDKIKGVVEFNVGLKNREHSLGSNVEWKFQKVLHQNHKGGFSEYHAVLIGSKGIVYIGATALTVKGLQRKIRKISEYYDAVYTISDDIINTHEAASRYSRWGSA